MKERERRVKVREEERVKRERATKKRTCFFFSEEDTKFGAVKQESREESIVYTDKDR
ncbi:hypothetical protein CSUI_006395 [Cystoisospora suis]|uniref:Uncharacterized protein n=1 Tax=Cystoisospora suis TaxID=483139 RepID=A0A2C6KU97_9APIC|nr:hypothetical protein CSUI_006395 [Cystoisospora suis]